MLRPEMRNLEQDLETEEEEKINNTNRKGVSRSAERYMWPRPWCEKGA